MRQEYRTSYIVAAKVMLFCEYSKQFCIILTKPRGIIGCFLTKPRGIRSKCRNTP